MLSTEEKNAILPPIGKITPKYKGEKNPSEKIIKLAQRITDRIGVKIDSDAPEYWGLRCVVTDEMADVALTMKVRKHYTFEQLCKLNKIGDSEEEKQKFQSLLDEMCKVGIMEYDYGDHYTKDGPIPNAPHIREYWVPLFVPGSGEYTNMKPPLMKENPELAEFFERMTYLPLAGITHLVPPGGAGIGMHVIPVEKAISMENQTMDIEHISYWLKKYEGHIGASICSCRHGRKTMGEGCADNYENWCIGVGDMADYCRETGKGRDITYDEAMEILKRAEDNGFVHQVTNIDGEGKIFAICNCNVQICNALRTSQLFNTPNLSRSAYVAHVDKESCVACGRCVEYCPAGSLKLGQKLCKKDGSEVKYPRQELPDTKLKWGPEKWNVNYRDDNRINTHKTGTAPCKTACPAHIAVQGYLKKAASGEYQDALALIKKQNPFPAVCGRICNRRCEEACTRGTVDEAVAIDSVKKFIADLDLNKETRFVPPIVVASNMGRWKEKIAIIGGGPAGLSAAFYLAEKGYYPTVFEKNEHPGGMLRYGIPSYKLQKDVIDAEIEVMKEMGVEIKTGIEVGKDITIDELRAQGYKAFYIAIGCSGGKLPGIPGEDSDGVFTAVDYLREANCGKTHFEGKVVVVGGGNVAIDAARVSRRSGAVEVTQLCLESEKEMPASDEEVTEAGEDGVVIKNGWGPSEVITENGKVTGVKFKKCLSVFNEEHRFAPVYDEEDTITIPCDRVIFAVGQAIVWGNMLDGTKVELGRGNGPVADALTYQTAQEDIFVGGDVYTGPKFAIDAIAAGHNAAESLHRFVQGGHMTIGRNRWEFNMLDKDDLSIESYDHAPRQEAGMKPSASNVKVGAATQEELFMDSHATLTEEQVKIETSRCLGCGASIVDPNRCIGCGVCTTKCMFDAIKLHRDRPECSKMTVSEDKFKHIIPYAAKKALKIIKEPKAD
ncbi:MAG: FAD-dependent oxidoreductase [Saccharofermentans sp.]|nr:FAD-dependent oxidoreductase [Saccharofermentans sp.]